MGTADKADPGPDMTTVIFHIWPLCLVSGLKTKCSNQRVFFLWVLKCWFFSKSSFTTFSFEPLFGDHPGPPGSPGLPGWADRMAHLLHPLLLLPLDVRSPVSSVHGSVQGQRETVMNTTLPVISNFASTPL